MGEKQLSQTFPPLGLLRFCGRGGRFRNRAHLASFEIRRRAFAAPADSLRLHSFLASYQGQKCYSSGYDDSLASFVAVAHPSLSGA